MNEIFKRLLLVIETDKRLEQWYGNNFDDPCLLVRTSLDDETWLNENENENIPCTMFASFGDMMEDENFNGKVVYVNNGILKDLENVLFENKENHINDLVALFEYERKGE